MENLTLAQVGILLGYFFFTYGYKALITNVNWVDERSVLILKTFIPAINLSFGLILGVSGLAGFDVLSGVLGALATGGAADLVQLPSKASKQVE